jgi:hypothetical protein
VNGQPSTVNRELEFTIPMLTDLILEAEIGEFIAQEEVQLNPGDVVVLYTDGIPEAFDINRAQYGLKRLWQVVVENRHRRALESRNRVPINSGCTHT